MQESSLLPESADSLSFTFEQFLNSAHLHTIQDQYVSYFQRFAGTSFGTSLAISSIVSETVQLKQDERAELAPHEQRKGERVRLHIPGEITGIDTAGQLFVEQIMIEDVNEVGCRFMACLHLNKGDVVAIKPLVPGQKCMPDEQPQLFEIAWTDSGTPVATMGARRLQGEKLANIKFPPANYSPRRRQE